MLMSFFIMLLCVWQTLTPLQHQVACCFSTLTTMKHCNYLGWRFAKNENFKSKSQERLWYK